MHYIQLLCTSRKFMRFISFLLVLMAFSCGQINPKIDLDKTRDLPINTALQTKLDLIINYKERLADSSSISERPSSYWIFPYERNDTCFVVIMANFDFYDSAEMDGYFEYRNKYISIYDTRLLCVDGLIESNELKILLDA